MQNNELLQHYKHQSAKAQYYLQRYIAELKLHFSLKDEHIIKIFEKEIKNLKAQKKKWFEFFKK